MTLSPHSVKAANIHVGTNKDKLLIVLYSSKTHSKESLPQEIKISSAGHATNTFFCPFKIVNYYVALRGDYYDLDENFFAFSDRTPVRPAHLRSKLRQCIKNINLEPKLYDCHSLRIGRSCDLMRSGMSIERIRFIGRWKSNAVFKYIRQL